MKNILNTFIGLLLLVSCSSNDTSEKMYPDCLSSKVSEISQAPKQTPKATIEKYSYQNQTVYKVNYIINDGSEYEVYNERCELVCAKGTTIDGTAYNSCIEWEKAVFIETVWTDPR